jgi:hypothetical protein
VADVDTRAWMFGWCGLGSADGDRLARKYVGVVSLFGTVIMTVAVAVAVAMAVAVAVAVAMAVAVAVAVAEAVAVVADRIFIIVR